MDSVRSVLWPAFELDLRGFYTGILLRLDTWHSKMHAPSEQEPHLVIYLCGPGIWDIEYALDTYLKSDFDATELLVVLPASSPALALCAGWPHSQVPKFSRPGTSPAELWL